MNKYYTDYPTLDDVIIFDIITTDKNGLVNFPYSVEKITIYYLEKTFKGKNKRYVQKKFYNKEIEDSFKEHRQLAKESPTEKNFALLRDLEKKLEETAIKSTIYYDQAKIVMSTASPLWIKDYQSNSINPDLDKDKNTIPGKFLFAWLPKGMREGSYAVRWDWRHDKDGKLNSAEKLFTILAKNEELKDENLKKVPRDKYDVLLTKYIPYIYYKKTKKNDLTPEVIRKLNSAIGQAFLEIEDSITGLVNLLNPDYIREDFLPLFSNFFKLTLRSDNVGAWRNQIKHALPLYKQKGTLSGLSGALDKAGIRLLKLTNLWQVVSPYTWTDCFIIENDNSDVVGYLTKRPIDMESPDFEVSIRSVDKNEYHILSNDVINLQEVNIPESKMAVLWKSEDISLLKGDFVKVRYKYKKIPDNDRSLENYIQNFLSLADSRDEKDTKYPLKNWNIRLIEETDPMFSLLIQERHPLTNPVFFGKIRTTFMYSEKIWNMDTFNGSLYNSTDPCDMDKDFLDTCGACQSSKFNIHVEMDQVSDDKIKEVIDIMKDYMPFHAVLHNMIINSKIVDVVLPPDETIKGFRNSKEKSGEKVATSEAIYCEIKYKDGRKFQGRIV